ncbi:MAG: hypothetical protein CMI54_01850 [Parcubacteria group bacterium]|nr:hypothetical protein [Parcubacteria group bacterium]|tara:strand:+ start:3924 stop:5051 length:1128 start_codon:yes stop_codon:yes gene_type:complete
MPGTRDFDNTTLADPEQTLELVADPNQEVDRAQGPGETFWVNPEWTTYNGFYRQYPEVKAQIDKLGLWTVGKGYDADEKTEKKLSKIRGFGKDSFNSIMENMVKIKKINGDSFAHIIKDSAGRLINLKPLNPGRTRIVTNEMGIIDRYELMDSNGKEALMKFAPEEIFHLTNDRTADEVHGVSIFEALKSVLKNIQQLDNDMMIVFHRFVVPIILWKLDTDDPDEIAKFKTKADKASKDGRNMYVPKDATDAEILNVAQFASLNPLDWRREWVDQAVKSTGIPEIILGSGQDVTEASAKIVYLAFQQTIEKEQRFVEEQCKLQLGIELVYEFPARIEENLGEDEGKDGGINQTKKSEVAITTIDKGNKPKAVSPK